MKALIASLAAAAALVLTGCTTTTPGPTVTVTAEATKPTETATKTPEVTVGPVERSPQSTPRTETNTGRMSDADFAALVRKENPSLNGVETSKIVKLAHSVCSAFDEGLSKESVFQILADGANGDRVLGGAMGYIAGAGVVVYCPEHQSKLS